MFSSKKYGEPQSGSMRGPILGMCKQIDGCVLMWQDSTWLCSFIHGKLPIRPRQYQVCAPGVYRRVYMHTCVFIYMYVFPSYIETYRKLDIDINVDTNVNIDIYTQRYV